MSRQKRMYAWLLKRPSATTAEVAVEFAVPPDNATPSTLSLPIRRSAPTASCMSSNVRRAVPRRPEPSVRPAPPEASPQSAKRGASRGLAAAASTLVAVPEL